MKEGKKRILIIPGCDDSNRGDQALIWESVRLAREAGMSGQYYMISDETLYQQSRKEGINGIDPILSHPSVNMKNQDNRKYTVKLIAVWGIRALKDYLVASLLKFRYARPIIKKILPKKKQETLNIFEKTDVAIVKGGGFLHAKSGVVEAYKICYFLYHIQLALSLGIPVIVMPNSYGPYESWISRKMVRRTLGKCNLVISRESISHNVLVKECRVQSVLSMDLGAYLEKDDLFDAETYLLAHKVPIRKSKCVAITVRPYRFPGNSNPEKLYDQYIKAIIEIMEWLSLNGYFIVLIEHVYSKTYHESDIKAIEDIEKSIKTNDKIKYQVIADHNLNCRQIKSIYSEFDYMIGTRFHSVIFALFSGIPSIAITYGGNKGQGIMRDLGLSKYAIPMDKVTGRQLILTFNDLIVNKNKVIDLLNTDNEKIAEQRCKLIELIKQVIGETGDGKLTVNC